MTPRTLAHVMVVWTGALTVGATNVLASDPHPRPESCGVTGWVVYWNPKAGLQAVEEHASALGEVAVFAYHFDEQRRLLPATPEVTRIIRTLRSGATDRRPRVLATIVNDVITASGTKRLKDPQTIHEILSTPEATAAHVEQLLEASAEADGVELDYENLRAEDRDAFSRLVQRLAAGLHADGKWLSVVVQPKTDHRVRDGAGALDWSAIAAHADCIKLMAYHYHHARGSPGPVAPPEWVEAMARFALTQIPEEKLCIVLTLHGFDWGQGAEGVALGHDAATRLASARQAIQERDEATGSPHFRYEAGGIRHEVWFEDGESLRRKITRLRRAGVRGIGLWHLGAGAPLVEEALRAARE